MRALQSSLPVTPSGTPESGTAKILQVIISLASSNTDVRVDETFQLVQAVTVVALTGAVVPSLRFGSVSAGLVPLALGQVRQDLAVEGGIYLTNAAGGGSLTLEIHGR